MTALQSKYTGWLIHVTVWAVILGMPLFVTGPDRPLMTGPQYVRFLLVPLSFMVVFYTNYFLLIDRYLTTRRFGRFTGYNLLLIGAVMLAVHLFFRHVLPPDLHRPPLVRPWQDTVRFFAGNLMLYILVVGAGVAIRMTSGWYRAETARQELEHSRTQAELQNLKSQLNPHFLFNTLNNIYSLIQLDTDRAQQAVHDLSRLLRYVLYDSSRPYVPLAAEVDFLRDYIELMRIRQPRHVQVFVSLPATPSQRPVAPLLFISLVENAFKHGVDNDRPSYVTIDLHESGDQLICRIKNSYFPKSGDSDRSGSGIGLSNLTRRLEMLYPGRHTFEYGQNGEAYTALLCIQLTDA
ncbi:MAG TPA: histidine kinase [Candidatus Alistipes intestinigallinarum]|uniref:Histidine kinase n=1 Tax=Candidatus Alistipes intestinigallinarum TaxID=2838440 RepID=A0A9D1YZZ5_9BACT|nr:histidine kinase [Candidatus Alistipes intestinigallinarum]